MRHGHDWTTSATERVGECEEAEGIAAPDDDRSHGPVNSSRGSISLA